MNEEFDKAFESSLKKIWMAFNVYLRNGSGTGGNFFFE